MLKRKNTVDRKYGSYKKRKSYFKGTRYTPRHQEYLIVHNSILDKIAAFVTCQNCSGAVRIDASNFVGLAVDLKVICEECGELGIVKSSANIPGTGLREINVRAVRLLGQGRTGLKGLCAFMNLRQPTTQRPWDSYGARLLDASEELARRSKCNVKCSKGRSCPQYKQPPSNCVRRWHVAQSRLFIATGCRHPYWDSHWQSFRLYH